MNALGCLRCELAIVGLALCEIALVVVLARSRAVAEFRAVVLQNRWDETFGRINERLSHCEARLTEPVAAGASAPPTASDGEIAAWLESLRDLASSLRRSGVADAEDREKPGQYAGRQAEQDRP